MAINPPPVQQGRFPPSPCIQICSLNEAHVCVGCHRHLKEIAGWGRMTAEEQWAIIRELPQRNPAQS